MERYGRGTMKLSEIASYMSVDNATAWRWIKKGIIPSMQLETGTIRVLRSDFEEFIKKIGGTATANNNATSEC